MAPEWEAAAMGVGPGMGIYHNTATPSMSGHHHHAFSHAPGPTAAAASHHFYADAMQMLDISRAGGAAHDLFPAAAASAGARVDAASSSDHHGSFNLSFADEFYIPVPSEEAAELEWLSNFVDDSYPDNMPNYPPEVQAAAAKENTSSATAARGKRSRATSAAWHSQLVPSSADSDSKQPPASSGRSKKNQNQSHQAAAGEVESSTEPVRRCTHCASEKTPQWRTGPLGPKTLCNACGVRYKSGRLVPEYRPAASPTFVLTQHSNSHRKVMELRRQKELVHLRGTASGSADLMFRDYGVC